MKFLFERRFLVIYLLTMLTLLAGCAPPTPAVTSTAASTPVSTEGSPTTAAVAPSATVIAGNTFQNPVIRNNFADPFILEVGDTFYGYATNSAGKNISLASSTDLVHWKLLADAMPALPKWAKLNSGLVWAPEVMQTGDKYVMYYTARDKASDQQCVGVAVSNKPEGKFKDTNAKPFVCQSDQGGTIDPDPFRDEDGKQYLYFKNDGNCCSMTTYIYGQELSQDGLSLQGQPVQLLSNDKRWEGGVIEAPTMFKHDGKYYLFYSANNYAGVEYAVGYANCESPLGPCQDAPENPILASHLENKNAMVIGPGHQDVFQLGDQTWIAYHAWEVVSGSRRGDRRFMWIDPIEWQDGRPVVKGPTTDSEPVPEVP